MLRHALHTRLSSTAEYSTDCTPPTRRAASSRPPLKMRATTAPASARKAPVSNCRVTTRASTSPTLPPVRTTSRASDSSSLRRRDVMRRTTARRVDSTRASVSSMASASSTGCLSSCSSSAAADSTSRRSSASFGPESFFNSARAKAPPALRTSARYWATTAFSSESSRGSVATSDGSPSAMASVMAVCARASIVTTTGFTARSKASRRPARYASMASKSVRFSDARSGRHDAHGTVDAFRPSGFSSPSSSSSASSSGSSTSRPGAPGGVGCAAFCASRSSSEMGDRPSFSRTVFSSSQVTVMRPPFFAAAIASTSSFPPISARVSVSFTVG